MDQYDENFYKTKEWVKKRKEILERDNFECQLCKEKALVTKANTVHHIKHYRDRPDLALEDDNLISVCANCHNKLHPERGFDSEDKIIIPERWE